MRRLRVAQLVGLATIVPFVIVVIAFVVGIITLSNQASVRDELVNRVEPANAAGLALATALVDQETGIRGYELSAIPSFLQPYDAGHSAEQQALATLRRTNVVGSSAALATVIASVQDWDQRVVNPAVAGVTPGHPHTTATVDAVLGKHLFDSIRSSLAVLQNDINRRLTHVKHELSSASRTTNIVLVAIAVALALTVLAIAVTLREAVTRPLDRLTRASRQVAEGELSRSLVVEGPVEIAQVSRDVDGMRQQLVHELEMSGQARDQLAATATDLERSNAELEQFAYIASHDLQEPLRKVTAFCQMLQDRYAGTLDERADTYIAFAVDGARRMQQLINDLLSFSRVGRFSAARETVDLRVLAQAAMSDLEQPAQAAGAEVVIGSLPELPVVPGLIRAVFQNLIANGIKFHSHAPPRVEINAHRREHDWLFDCTDNGIGIDPEYADRIFVIFQRLHARDRYDGTGIGLAICRKIIEYHGGEIWLDKAYSGGTRIYFTLPAAGSETMVA
ncbi:MAG: ATP-binding protein [Solirubrobacteraceae bacterium]